MTETTASEPDVSPEVLQPIVAAIEAEFEQTPPTLAVIGLSGVGKSSLINAMFATKRTVSATRRGTHRFSSSTVDIVSERVAGAKMTCKFRVIDAVGLGEDASLDGKYLKRYREHLPKADIALWVIAARNRALALDQQYLEQLADVLPNLVIGISQVDLVDPLDWNAAINMPSKQQGEHIAEIVADRTEKLAGIIGYQPPAVPFAAPRYYNLQTLYKECLSVAPVRRRWMFEILKSFSTRDWLAQAKGLTAKQRAQLEQRFVTSDRKIKLEDLGR